MVIAADVESSAESEIVLPNATLIPPPALSDSRVGYVNFWKDPVDGKVRSAIFSVSERQLSGQDPYPGEEQFRSFAARGLERLGRGADVPADARPHLLRFSALGAYPPRTLYEVFDPKFWHANYGDGAYFKDKLVLIGSTSQVRHDVVPTPMDPDTLGPEMHLEAHGGGAWA